MLAGALCGACNGLAVTQLRIQPFIATLAMTMAAHGIALLLADNQPVAVSYDSGFTDLGQGDWLGLPRDYLQAALIRVEWPLYVAFREGVSRVLPGSFYLFDEFVRGVAMLYLNNGTSPTQTPITLPTANRPGA